MPTQLQLQYDNDAMKRLSVFIEHGLLEYSRGQARMVTAKEFADYLGMTEFKLSRLRREKARADLDDVFCLAKIGEEVYDITGVPRPDGRLRKIIANWGYLAESTRDELCERVLRELNAASSGAS